ncbi:nuclease [Pseudodesulfovibrio sp. JC047]|uniref:thermonuclease family protein n=1 Tax=Pseudodesulfovibrio sp. JC047 TaxID=2683199 RepID=UPI0013D1F692|nr:thermonuclease family protein [Pseudodesulfovibrio sp. JC047]NDV18221.1 nuclease [Pseudodesulfovibrio sp. JC047]
MSFRNLLFTLSLVGILAVFSGQALAQDVQFLHIIDGDSLVVVAKGDSVTIRLLGVDAPERGQEYGKKATIFSLKFCYGKQIRLEFDRRRKDRYGRTLAYVYADGALLNTALIQAGLALATPVKPNTKYASLFKKTEENAKKEKQGFWRCGGLKKTPAQWRKKHRYSSKKWIKKTDALFP